MPSVTGSEDSQSRSAKWPCLRPIRYFGLRFVRGSVELALSARNSTNLFWSDPPHFILRDLRRHGAVWKSLRLGAIISKRALQFPRRRHDRVPSPPGPPRARRYALRRLPASLGRQRSRAARVPCQCGRAPSWIRLRARTGFVAAFGDALVSQWTRTDGIDALDAVVGNVIMFAIFYWAMQ